jgi:D-glycero-D-manno-heptose 1,7-bisphosphate phosphatase
VADESANLVILSRDGVINQPSPDHIKTAEEWVPIPGSLEAIARLNHAGFSVVVATNQPGIGAGLFGISALNAVHDRFRQELARVGGHVDAIFFCPHIERDGCDCRKPRPGLLREIETRYGQPITGVPVIGCSPEDADAALACGTQPILVGDRRRWQWLDDRPDLVSFPTFEDLATATCFLLDSARNA